MVTIKYLPQESWSNICLHLDSLSICALQGTNKDIREKTICSMSQSLKTITVTMTYAGVDRLQALTKEKAAIDVEKMILYPPIPIRKELQTYRNGIEYPLIDAIKALPNLKTIQLSNRVLENPPSFPMPKGSFYDRDIIELELALYIYHMLEAVRSNVELHLAAENLLPTKTLDA
jgi:hypothetical protein